MPPTARLRVIYGDTDQMGVVYYANYLRYFEVARAEWLRARGYEYRQFEIDGFLLPVIEAHVRYRAPARYDDQLEIDAVVTQPRAASVRFDYAIRRISEADLLVEGYTVHACIGRDGRPRRLPDSMRALLSAPVREP